MLGAGWEVLLKFRREIPGNCSAGVYKMQTRRTPCEGILVLKVKIEGSWKGGIIGSSLGLEEERRCAGQIGGLKWGSRAELGMCP